MIRTFRHKGLRSFFEESDRRGVPPVLAERLTRRLDALDVAKEVGDMNLPGFRLHALKGDRKGTWSIWVSGNWRITFSFRESAAFDVNLEDYH